MKSGRQGEEAAEEPGSEREKTEAATARRKAARNVSHFHPELPFFVQLPL